MTPLTETALGVLFLAHGRAPVLLGKLNYSAVLEGAARNAPWHQRPRDAGNLTRYVGAQLEQLFNWQIINLSAPVEDMLEAPVLLVTGSKTIVFTPNERAKIKGYLDGGGIILATSESAPRDGVAGHDDFSRSRSP